MRKFVFLALSCVALFAFTVLGDTLHLSNGTTIQGRVIDEGDKYWVKDNDGETHLIDKNTVTSITKDSETPSPASIGASSTIQQPAPGASDSFATVKARAERCDTAIGAVTVWQAFIDSKPSASDLAAAKKELAHWQEVLDGDGEKINGKWIWGPDHDKLIQHVSSLLTEGIEALRANQTLLGISKLEQAVQLYPNSFEANFELGYFNLVRGVDNGRNNAKINQGVDYLEKAVKLEPNCAAAWSDLAIGYSLRQRYVLSVQTAYKAAKIEDSKKIVENLVNSIAWAPPGMQKNSEIRPIIEETGILAAKYGISSQPRDWNWVRPDETAKPKVATGDSAKPGDDEETPDGPPRVFSVGTGFFISDSGYILTNRHVAKPGSFLVVKLPDNVLKLAQRVVIDDDQDMAVIKIKVAAPVPFVRLAPYDHPPVGADVDVFGFPLQGMTFGMKSSVKMTRGIVTAWDKDNLLCDVTVDATVNPGNSGGPMVDHYGNLLALTAMKTIGNGEITTYGLGYSTQRVRKFLNKQKDKLPGVNLAPAADNGAVLSNEDLATRLTPCTLCIMACSGTPPAASSDGNLSFSKE